MTASEFVYYLGQIQTLWQLYKYYLYSVNELDGIKQTLRFFDMDFNHICQIPRRETLLETFIWFWGYAYNNFIYFGIPLLWFNI